MHEIYVWRQLVDKKFNSSCRAPCSHFSSSSQLRNSTTFEFVAAFSEPDELCISSMRCSFHTLHVLRVRLSCVSFRHVAHTRRVALRRVVHTSSTRRAYLFDASCIPLRRVVHTSSTRRAYLFDASCIPLRRVVRTSSTRRAYLGLFDATCSSSTRRVALRRVTR